MYPVRRIVSPHAAELRRNSTDAERVLWSTLRNRQLAGLKFRRQPTVGNFIVDFLCVEAGLVVEADGGQHAPERDALRTAYLEAEGLRVIRFWNNEVLGNLSGVLTTIADAADKKKTLTRPSPAKAGEG